MKIHHLTLPEVSTQRLEQKLKAKYALEDVQILSSRLNQTCDQALGFTRYHLGPFYWTVKELYVVPRVDVAIDYSVPGQMERATFWVDPLFQERAKRVGMIEKGYFELMLDHTLECLEIEFNSQMFKLGIAPAEADA